VFEGIVISLRRAWGRPAVHPATAVRHRWGIACPSVGGQDLASSDGSLLTEAPFGPVRQRNAGPTSVRRSHCRISGTSLPIVRGAARCPSRVRSNMSGSDADYSRAASPPLRRSAPSTHAPAARCVRKKEDRLLARSPRNREGAVT